LNSFLDSLDHITVITKDLNKTKDFYVNILGMNIDHNRPPFKFNGIWLSLNNRAVVHVVVKPEHIIDENILPTLDHVAFRAKDMKKIKLNLNKNTITYEERVTPDNKISQLFLKDPNGIKIEISQSV
tara:strand:+ start:126 stop:506 length:381 start_codon:yes stop_codon:yes gene_type:complete